MIKLDRKRNGFQALIVPFAVGCFFWALFSELRMPIVISGSIAGIAFLIPLIAVIESIRKPAAWIEEDILNIRGGFSSTTTIRLADVESMHYQA